ncbi:winged helix-turn-helix transcriptional regulator [Poseidonocella sp. HB161398]|uniref:winged helix-turn-helix transcriptional regulator n=1 Tax=Poseidonocella sp. HB161398 TaxID=2320855 RepID=UPI001107B8BE|nr:winged helix-turn-helix transcriptional regulator [Poseidonocella sp. HB161398]
MSRRGVTGTQRRQGAEARRRLALSALERPRTQAELRDLLGMSNSGVLHLLRRLERDGLARPAEKVGWTRIWEKTGCRRG